MSYNITATHLVHSKGFSIHHDKWARLVDEAAADAAESSVFDDDMPEVDGRLYPGTFSWSGEGSGHLFDTLKDVLAAFDGEADLLIIWEGGDRVCGLRLRDHKVTEHEIIQVFGNEI